MFKDYLLLWGQMINVLCKFVIGTENRWTSDIIQLVITGQQFCRVYNKP